MKRSLAIGLPYLVLVLISTNVLAQEEHSHNDATHPANHGHASIDLSENLKDFAPYLGVWEVEAQWASGQTLWAKNHYRVGVGGKFVEAATWAKDRDGEVYQRYLTIFGVDSETHEIMSHGFASDGKVTQVKMEIEKPENGHSIIRSQWQPTPDNDMMIKQEVQILDENRYRWQVWSGQDENWTSIMEGVWQRVDEAGLPEHSDHDSHTHHDNHTHHGSDGRDGKDGADGRDGEDGMDGEHGADGR